jgi:beta-N-acetylhexosaminidase
VAVVIFTDDVRSEFGRTLERQLRTRVPDANVIYVDPNNAEFEANSILATVGNAERVVAALFVAPQPGKKVIVAGERKSTVSLLGAQRSLFQSMLERAGSRMAVVALGSPYVATEFPTVQTYLCTFSNAPVSEISTVKALFGEIPVRGRLPVSIPGIAQRGDGIETARGGSSDVSQGRIRTVQ